EGATRKANAKALEADLDAGMSIEQIATNRWRDFLYSPEQFAVALHDLEAVHMRPFDGASVRAKPPFQALRTETRPTVAAAGGGGGGADGGGAGAGAGGPDGVRRRAILAGTPAQSSGAERGAEHASVSRCSSSPFARSFCLAPIPTTGATCSRGTSATPRQ